MRCERIEEWMGDRLDGRLDADCTREMDEHLAGCSACRREFEELRQTVTLLRGLEPIAPPSDLLPRIHRRLARRQESPLVVFWRVLSLPQTRVAAAAALAVMVGAYGWRTMTAGHGGAESDLAYTHSVTAIPSEPMQYRSGQSPTLQKTERTDRFKDKDQKTAEASKLKDGKDDRRVVRKTPASAAVTGVRAASAPPPPTLEKKQSVTFGHGTADSGPVPTDKLAAAKTTLRSPASAANGQLWHEPAAEGGGDRAKSLALKPGLTVGTTSGSAADREDTVTDSPATPATEIALTTRDAAAVRKILAHYVVRREVANEETATGTPAKDSATRRDQTVESDSLITGWVPAARYAQLLADLQSVGTVNSRAATRAGMTLNKADASRPAQPAQEKSVGAEMLFVRITLVPPAR